MREALQLPRQARAAGRNRDSRGGNRLPEGLRPRQDADDSAEAYVPLQQRPAGDGGQLCRRLQPRRQPQVELAAQAISGVRALGRYTLQIRTTRPLLDLVYRLTTPFFCPIAVNTPLAEINDPLGSGPYYVADRVPNRQVVLKRNPFYRWSRPANVDQIVMTMAAGQAACRAAVDQNELDYCAGAGIPQADFPEIVAKYGINRKGGRFFFNPTLGVIYFAFNHDRPAFKGVGQIPLNQAINRPCARASRGAPGREADRPDLAAGHHPARQHLSAWRRLRAQPGQGASAREEGEVQAPQARPLHGQLW